MNPLEELDPQTTRKFMVTQHNNAILELKSFLDQTTPDQRRVPNLPGNWSIADLLAHLIAHQNRAIEEVELALCGERLVIDHTATDAFNAAAVESMRGWPVERVLAAWDSSCRALAELIANLPDEAFIPNGKVEQLLDDTVEGALANNSWEHVGEHLCES